MGMFDNPVTGAATGGVLGGPMGATLGGAIGVNLGGIGDLAGDVFGGITGQTAADAAIRAAEIQAAAGREGLGEIRAGREQALGMLSPFQEAGAAQLPGISSLITDPEAQRRFVQENPFFQSLAGQATRELTAKQAAGGKLGTGGTAAALQERLLGLGTGLVGQNIQQRMGLAGMGLQAAQGGAQTAVGTSGSIADLMGSIGAAQAAGQVGAAQAQQQGISNLLGIGALALCDIRCKKDIEKVGEYKDFPVYKFKYIWDDEDQIGFMAQDVEKVIPEAVIEKNKVKYVDYGKVRKYYAH